MKMFWKRNKTIVVVDRSAMLAAPARHPLHFLYALLLAISFAAALWQYGHPHLTIGLLAAVLPCSLAVFLPYRIYPSMLRAAVNCIFFGGICLWGLYRMKNGVMPDKAMLESLAAASLIFLMKGQRRDLHYVLFISLFLFIYGALIPRMLYLWLLTPYFILFLLLLYANRPEALANGRPVAGKHRFSLLRSWPYYLINLLSGVCIFWYLFGIMPLTDNDVPGIFEVSFLTERDSALPPEVHLWLYGDKVKRSPAGKLIVRDNKPDSLASRGTPLKVRSRKAQANAKGDGESASQGKDLLFYVKTPLKLYHLAQLYDMYDGDKWTTSPRQKRTRLRTGNEMSLFHQVSQNYTIVKWISPKLYAAFAPLSYQSQNAGLLQVRINTNYFSAELFGKEYPATPFSYTVNSAIVFPQKRENPDLYLSLRKPQTLPARKGNRIPPRKSRKPQTEEKERPLPSSSRILPAATGKEAGKNAEKRLKQTSSATKSPRRKNSARQRRRIPRDPYWPESVPKSCYLQLPKRKIPARVGELAEKLTEKLESPYDKAVTLRDYLRNNFKYLLYAQKTPPGKESVDYFLFTLKAGHCEYFASALTVLARFAGLPARVATGFSPGNYNTLTKQFEVHEYHAHAWTQIYIDRIGWLTFDATPPQQIRSETRPAGFGSLRDPFGDEWRITPPEITKQTLEHIRSDIIRETRKEEDASALEKALIRTAIAQEAIQENITKNYTRAKKHFDRKNKEGFLFRLERKLNELHGTITELLLCIRRSWIVLLMFLIIILTSGSICRRAAKLAANCWKRKKMEQFIKTAGEEMRNDPGRAIRAVYFALRLALELSGFQRKRNMELLDYASSLKNADPDLAEKTSRIFLVFYKLEYGTFSPRMEDAETALALLQDIRRALERLRTGTA